MGAPAHDFRGRAAEWHAPRLVAVPTRSKRLWRLDVAFPLSDDPHASWELRLSSRDATRVFWREPDDMQRGREASIRSSIFAQPSY